MSNTGGIQSLARASVLGSVTTFSGFPLSPRITFRTTGDAAILDQMVPFLDGKPLEEQQTESLSIPVASATEGSLLEHCRRPSRDLPLPALTGCL